MNADQCRVEMEKMAASMNDLLLYIPKGKANAISRKELCNKSGVSDRLLRKEIETLQKQGIAICNIGEGYYIATKKAELEPYIKVESSRRRKQIEKCSALYSIYADMGE